MTLPKFIVTLDGYFRLGMLAAPFRFFHGPIRIIRCFSQKMVKT